MAKFWQLLLTYVGLPLLKEGLSKLYKWVIDSINKAKKKKEDKKKLQEFKDAKTKDEHTDTFSNLP